MVADIVRIARELGVPLAPPASHPFNPLLPLRVAVVEPRANDALFAATWAKSQPVDGDDAVARVLDEAGFDGRKVVAQAHEPDTKWRLRKQTDEAIGAGVFGVPTMIARDQMFWGVDSLGHLERYLDGKGVDVQAELKKWAHVRPTASRA